MEEEVVKHSMVGLKMFPSPAARAVSCGGLKHSLQQKKETETLFHLLPQC